MARPERNSVDYFPFICKEGKAMYYIETKYGNDGFSVWIKTLRQLATTNYHYLNLNNETDLMFLSSKCKVTEEKLISIINDLSKLGEFNKLLWQDNRIIWSDKFIESIQDAYKKRINKCITFDGLLTLLHGLGIRKLSKSNSEGGINTQSKVKESKVKESKVKESKVNIPSFEDFKNYALENKKNTDIVALDLKYKSWIENGWKDGFDNPIKNWKSKLLNTLQYLSEKNTKSHLNHDTDY